MKIWALPRVSLLQVTNSITLPAHFEWESDTPIDADALPEFAGRLCYLSFGGSGMDGHATVKGRSNNAEYLRNIRKQKHGSVLEHSVFSLLFEGVSRTLTHELVRHRHLSYSQLSQRYVDETGVGVVIPIDLLKPAEQHMIPRWQQAFGMWERQCENACRSYGELMKVLAYLITNENPSTADVKRLRGAARSVLPACAETKVVVTGNIRAWRHFLALRGAEGAEAEIRRLAVVVAYLLRDQAPSAFADAEIDLNGVTLTEGTF